MLDMSRGLDPIVASNLMVDHGLAPLETYPGAQAPWLCQCMRCGQDVRPRYNNIKQGWGGCRDCGAAARGAASRRSEQDAVAAIRAADLDPIDTYLGRKVPWRCRCLKCGKVVTPRLDGILAGQSGCKWCAKRAVDSVAAMRVMATADLEPLEPYPGSDHPWRCRCLKCDTEVTPRYNNVRQGHSGCVHCRHKETGGASQRLSHKAASAVMLEHGFLPLEPYRNSITPWRCQCRKCGSEVTPRYSNVRSNQGGCSVCKWAAQSARQRRPEGVAVSLMRSAGVEPLEPFQSAAKTWLCRCIVCARIVTPRLSGIERGQGACKYCAGCAVDPEEAAVRMRIAGMNPLENYPGRHAPWSCFCLKCHQVVTPSYGSIVRGQGGCRWCGKSGFRARERATVYLIQYPEQGAIKIGITDSQSNRMSNHRKRGWHLLNRVEVAGGLALAIEKSVLRWWRIELGLPPHLSKSEMPQGGWTETVDADAIDIPVTIERIRMLAASQTIVVST